MPYFVVLGRAVSTRRGMVAGGDLNSEIIWADLCAHLKDAKAEAAAKESIARLLELGILVEADVAPGTPEDAEQMERDRQFTQKVNLTDDGTPVGNLNKAQSKRLAETNKVSYEVPMTEPDKTPAELAAEAAAQAKLVADNAQKAVAEAEDKARRAAIEAQTAAEADEAERKVVEARKEPTASPGAAAPVDPPTPAPVGAVPKTEEDPLNPIVP